MNIRNRGKVFALTIAVPLCMAAGSSVASPDVAMQACVDAFVSSSLAKQPVAVETQSAVRSVLIPRSRPYSIVLEAKGKESGKRVARATCLVERDGTVIALNGKPVPALLAKVTLTAADK
jgi:hypothetical protein